MDRELIAIAGVALGYIVFLVAKKTLIKSAKKSDKTAEKVATEEI